MLIICMVAKGMSLHRDSTDSLIHNGCLVCVIMHNNILEGATCVYSGNGNIPMPSLSLIVKTVRLKFGSITVLASDSL